MKKRIKIEVLFEKYINKTINEDELFQLHSFFQTEKNQQQLEETIEGYFASGKDSSTMLHENSAAVESLAWNEIQQSLGALQSSRVHRISWITKFVAAAAILLVISFGLYFIPRSGSSVRLGLESSRADVQPGTNRATLISSNGVIHHLSGIKQEIITEKGSIRYKDGTLVENQVSDQNVTLSTPKGGHYCVTLSDGTKVWLNAASSLSYPTSFAGKERSVELIGEAYFEVHHDAKQPFIVRTNGQQVKVLGTSFNINAYQDEYKTVTTLVNGRVQLSREGSIETPELHPGEQSVLAKAGFEVAKVEVSQFVAWKDGQFRFAATPLIEAMRQIERWYDLDIDYTGIPADVKIHASISRNKKLSTVIVALEKITDLKFDVKGRSVKLMQ